ncbi:MAG: hypothetical protein IT377_31070 [Polyangiaceae bacterium]|nr:hypothetical protein [Polyangiaceae bacterium]
MKRTVGMALGAGAAIGVSGALLHRYVLSVDKGQKPLPMNAQVAPGAVPTKLEIDKVTNVVSLRQSAAAAMIELLKGYELDLALETPTSASYKLKKLDTTKPASASAASWAASAAKAGWDVLVDTRLTALLDGGAVQPAAAAGPDLVVARKAATPSLAMIDKPYAVLVVGDNVTDGLLPGLPGAVLPPQGPTALTAPAPAPAPATTVSDKAVEVAKAVTSGITRVHNLVVGEMVSGSSTKYGLAVGAAAVLLTGGALAFRHHQQAKSGARRFRRDDSYRGVQQRARMGW